LTNVGNETIYQDQADPARAIESGALAGNIRAMQKPGRDAKVARQLKDGDIRIALLSKLRSEHADDGTLIIEEMGLCQNDVRVDIAAINGRFCGYEIKSDRDTLVRLPKQRTVYGKCFDQMTLVVGERYAKEAFRAVPSWWGILVATSNGSKVIFDPVRPPQTNERVSVRMIVKLLWKAEALQILSNSGVLADNRTDCMSIHRKLIKSMDATELRNTVRERIKARGDWRSVKSPFRRDDSSRSSAMILRSQQNRAWLLSLQSQNLPS
jgi:hypothetical protein